MKVLVEKTPRPMWEFLNVNCYETWEGFYKMGYEIGFFSHSGEDLMLPFGWELDPETIVYGSIQSTRLALKQLGVEQPPALDYPSELSDFLYRKLELMTMGEFKKKLDEYDFGQPYFVKPVAHKLFSGVVVKNFADLIRIAHVPDDTEVWMSNFIPIFSEWRVFVLRGQVVGMKHYNGNMWVTPSKFEIERMIGAYKSAPVAYSLDVGLIAKGCAGSSTCLVEVNDAFALGSYGLPGIKYCQMIEARWKELVSGLL